MFDAVRRGPAWLGEVAALASGAALPLAFAPFAWRPLTLICLAILFLTWQRATPRRALLRGWLFGLGYFGVGVHWVYYSVHLFGDAAAPLAGLVAAGFVLLLSLFPAAVGWLATRWFADRSAAWWLLLVPALWLLLEWSRSWVLTGFPWLAIGYTGLDTPLENAAPIIGSYGLGYLLALAAGALGLLLVGRGRERYLAAALLALIYAGALLLPSGGWTQPNGEPLRVRLLQGNYAQHQKFIADLLLPSLRSYSRGTLDGEPVDLVLWPETAVPTSFGSVAGPLMDLAAQAEARGTAVIAGGFYHRPEGGYHNSLWLLGSEQFYHKRHLVPFGEYMPFRALLEFLAQFILIPMSDLLPGEGDPQPMLLGEQRLAASICYEAVFGAEIIRQLPEATLLVNVSNDGWFGDSLAPHQHLEMVRMRALESGRDVLRATNTGISALIDHRGTVRQRSEQFVRSRLDGEVQGRSGATPYVGWGDWPAVLLAIAAALGGAVICRGRAKKST